MGVDKFEWTDELVKEWVDTCNQKFNNPELFGAWLGYSTEIQKFKEEHTKPKVEWEIVYMKHKDGFPHEYNSPQLQGSTCEEQRCDIYSVRRLSDGEVFTVGDEVEYYDGNKAAITWFDQDGFRVKGSGDKFYTSINRLKKVTKPIPLFKTEEGQDVFDGEQTCFYVSDFRIRERKAKNMAGITNKRFISKEAAENYILTNKPLLSVNEIMQMARDRFEQCGAYRFSHGELRDSIIKIAKEKLSK